MARDVPQRDLRHRTAELLRRVEAGERFRITVRGHPVAELRPLGEGAKFVARDELIRDFAGLLAREDDLELELREADTRPDDPLA